MDRDLTLRISVKDDGTVVVRKFAESAKKSIEGAGKAVGEVPASASRSWGSLFSSIGSGFKTVGGVVISTVSGIVRSLTSVQAIIGGAFAVAGVYKFAEGIYSLDQRVLKAGEDFRRFEVSMTGVLGSATRARELTQYTLERALVSPAQTEDIRQVVQSLAMMPSTRVKLLASDFDEVTESLNELTDTVIGLASMRPDQGISGALMAIREALGGQWRSFQFRFDINPEIIAASIGRSLSEITGDTELTQQAIDAFRKIMMPEETMREMSRMPSVLIGNIKDAFAIAFKEIGDFGLYDWLVDEIGKASDRIREVIVEDLGKKGIGAGLAASLKVFTTEGAGLVKAAGAGIGRVFFPDIEGRADIDMYQKVLLGITKGIGAAAGGFSWVAENLQNWIPKIADWVSQIPSGIERLIEEVRHVGAIIEIRASQMASWFSFGVSGTKIAESYLTQGQITDLVELAKSLGISTTTSPTGFGFGGVVTGGARPAGDIIKELLQHPLMLQGLEAQNREAMKTGLGGISADLIDTLRGAYGLRDWAAEVGEESKRHETAIANIRPGAGLGPILDTLESRIHGSIEEATRFFEATIAEFKANAPWDKLGGWKKQIGSLGMLGIEEQVREATTGPLDTLADTYNAALNELNKKWETLEKVKQEFGEWSDRYLDTNKKLTDDQLKSFEELMDLIEGAELSLQKMGREPEIYRTTQLANVFTGGDAITRKQVWEMLQGRDLGVIRHGYLGLAESMVGYMQDSSWQREIRRIESEMTDPRRSLEERKASLDEWVTYQKEAYRAVLDNFGWSEDQKIQLAEVFNEKMEDINQDYLESQKALMEEEKRLWTDYCDDVVQIHRDAFSEGIFRTMRGEIDSLRDVFESFVVSLQRRFADLAADWVFAQLGFPYGGGAGGGQTLGSVLQSIPVIGNLFGRMKAGGGLSGGPYGWGITGETQNIEATIPLQNGAVPVRMMGGASQAPVYVINTFDPPELVAAGLPSNARIIVSQVGNDLFRRGPLSRQLVTAR